MSGTASEASWPTPVIDPHIEPHLATSALVVIDTQVDFVDGGASAVAGTTAVLPEIVRLRAAYRAAGRPIVHVVRLYRDGDVDLVRRTALGNGLDVVRSDSPGSQVVPELRDVDVSPPPADRLLAGEIVEIGDNEYVMWKPRWSAFFRTALDEHLRRSGIDTVVVAGCNFPNCPRATIVDASERDYRVLVAADAISGMNPLHLQELGLIGALYTQVDTITSAVVQAAATSAERG